MYKDYTESDVENTKKIGKIVGVTLGTLIGQDLNVSQLISANAIDNNYAHLAIWGVAAAGTAYSAYQVYKAYESGGATAALKTLGIEVVTIAVGGAFVKGAMAGGKLAFRFIGDTKTYATVSEILSVAYEGTPGLKHCVKSIHNKIVQVFERFEGSTVGQTLAAWDAKLAGRSAAVAEAEVVDVDKVTGLLSQPKMADHHIFPRQFKKFFEGKGINIDEHTISLVHDTSHLRGIHGNGFNDMPGKWNFKWKEFIENNPTASQKEVYQFAGKLLDEYNINNIVIHGYKK
ncbi:MAG: hypothetical protein HEEMFOPI_01767 [Holosporales bacterium]